MQMDIVEHIAHITLEDGRKAQVLVLDEDGNPIGWDEAATAALAAQMASE